MSGTLTSFRTFPLAVRLLLINQFGVNLGFYLLIPYLATYLTDDIGLSLAVVGVILGVRNLAQQGLFLLGGTAADRLGARGVIIAGCGLRTVGFGLFALGESMPVLLAAAVLSGLAGALFNPAVRAYIAVATDRRAEAFALFNVFAQAGALAGPALGAVLVFVDFRVSALVAAGIFALLTLAQAAVLPGRAVPPQQRSVPAQWSACLRDRRFLAFTLALSGMFALQNQLYLVLAVAAQRATGWASAVAALFAVSTAVTFAGQVPITRRLGARPERGPALALGMVVMGAGFALLGAAPLLGLVPPLALIPVLVTTVFLAVGVMIAQPFVYELIPAFTTESDTGTYFGMFYLVSGVVAAVSTAAVGALGELGGRPTGWVAALVCAGIGFGCAAAVLLLHRFGALPRAEVTA
ncbi:MFS transporter [Nocardia asteroides]|uniref:MFS transporter n=1 Tax=Nocardia asteroides TaxID=1824 RepID=UPI001E5EF6A7|nr:MFS transporter [Nocardia asteroides]UGT63089.1 MFS transporter [Nocardia asteroides]